MESTDLKPPIPSDERKSNRIIAMKLRYFQPLLILTVGAVVGVWLMTHSTPEPPTARVQPVLNKCEVDQDWCAVWKALARRRVEEEIHKKRDQRGILVP